MYANCKNRQIRQFANRQIRNKARKTALGLARNFCEIRIFHFFVQEHKTWPLKAHTNRTRNDINLHQTLRSLALSLPRFSFFNMKQI